MSIHAWLIKNEVKNEKGHLLEFDNHPFLFDIYADQSQNMTVMKAAQVGMTTCEFLKNHYDAKHFKMDIIYCVDDQTEILTQRGFLYQNELKDDDIILTIDKNYNSQWSDLQEVFRKEVDIECAEFDTRNFNALVTLNHRWLLQPYRGNKPMFFRETKDMVGRYAKIPKCVYKGGTTINPFYANEEVELLAWIFAEGYYPKQTKGSGKKSYSIIISQSVKTNSLYCEEIRNILRNLGSDWKEYYYKHNQCINFRFAFRFGKKIRERFPNKKPDTDFAMMLTREQCQLFIETFVKADGWVDKSGTMAISQKDKQTVDVLCMIAVLGGYSPSVIEPGKNGCYTVRMTQFKSIETNELKLKKVQYKGVIWCPRTEYGTFYARRKGHCYWTGNTLPTDNDVKVMVGGKFNRIIAANQCMINDVADKDSVEQKKVGESMIYFRGTWSKKAAMMIPADRLVHDEVDSSKLDVVADYQARLQHSKFKQTHIFSHPSLPEIGVHASWLQSDQKHWFIKCPHCNEWQYLSWNTEDPQKMSVDLERRVFICKKCRKHLPDYVRKTGQWVKKYKDRNISGYWVPLLIAPWVSAADLIMKFKDPNTSDEFWYTKVLGLPYADASAKLLRESFLQNLTGKLWNPGDKEKVIMGIDTGLKIDYVLGNDYSLFYHGECKDYDELNGLMKRWPKMIAVIDQGGDLIGSRQFYERWPGRVFLCTLTGDRITKELVKWKSGDEYGACNADRNRMIQLVVDEFRTKRIRVHGDESDWYEYWLDWNNLSKTKIVDPVTNQIKGYKWVRNGRDHRALATVFWRIGVSRFSSEGGLITGGDEMKPNSYFIRPDNKVEFDPKDFFDKKETKEEEDWRL